MEQHWDGEHGRHEDHQCERRRRRLEQRRLGRLLGRLRLLSSLGSAAPRPLRLGLLAGATEKRYRARAVRCAAPFCDLMRPFAIAVRSGLHIDEIELKRDDVAGMAVHIAARVAVEAKVGETVVSSIVRDLVAGSGLRFEDRGLDSLRGLPDRCTFTRFRVANKGGWGQRAELPLAGSWSCAIKNQRPMTTSGTLHLAAVQV